jgi:flagellar export protein FliJ
MKRYSFRLETVLKIRRIEEEQAKAALTQANHAITTAETEFKTRVDNYGLIGTPAGPRNLHDFMTQRHHHAAAAAAIVAGASAVHTAKADAETARGTWNQAASRVTALENLDERSRAEHALEAAKEADMEIDDLVTSRHGRAA